MIAALAMQAAVQDEARELSRLLVEARVRSGVLEALRRIAARDTGMKSDFSVGAKQAEIARDAIAKATGAAQ